jgi:tRNA dimethylallyltransferase
MKLDLIPVKPIIVCGPTGSGKTKLGLKLAAKLNGEIINADSRQVYRFLDIGTNKENVRFDSELNLYTIKDIPIHLIDLVNPDENYTVYQFVLAAEVLISKMLAANITPILVGGTGLYIDALVKGYELKTESVDIEKREKLNLMSVVELQQMLIPADLAALNDSDRQNPRRLIRRIEQQQAETGEMIGGKFDYQILFINPEISEIETKLEQRAAQMWQAGIAAEVKAVLAKGFAAESPALQGIGYRQVLAYLNNEINQSEAIHQIYLAHRGYAKRQLTWFRKYLAHEHLSDTKSKVHQLSLAQVNSILN